jgi:exodeoxyribonuclease-5
VLKIVREQEVYGFRFADVEIVLLDYPNFPSFEVKILLDTLHLETPSMTSAQQKALYHAGAEDYLDLGDRKKIHKAVMSDPYYNALQVKFAYAVTCHKSQGGQWPAVVVDQGYLTEELLDIGLLRWFYTALTRAQQELYLLNFHPNFFGEGEEE